MREEAVQIVPDSVKRGVLALALHLPAVKAAEAVAKTDNFPKFRLSLPLYSRQ